MADNDITYCRIPELVAERWKVVRDVIAGDQHLRNDTYLPYLNKSDASPANVSRNKAYKERAVLYTATGFTLAGMIGLAFRHDPKYSFPAQLDYLLKDCDGAGVSIYQQSQAVLSRNIGVGRHGLYVDFSSALKRPIIKAYFAEDIINWRESLVGGKVVRTLVVLREDAEIDDGYATVCVDQWRELFLNEQGLASCRIWRKNKDGVPEVVLMEDADGNLVPEVVLRSSGAPLDEIPFDFVGSQNNDSDIDDSPLYGLARVNVAHFRNSADYEDSVFFVGQAQPWIAGLDEGWRDHLEQSGTMYIGSRAPMLLPVGGAFGFAQALPNMLAKEAMDQKELQMVALGARLIDKTTAAKTATQSEGEREASTSILALCVANVSEAYQSAIRRCARYLDFKLPADEDPYEINQDFTAVSSDPLTINALVAAWQAGLMAKSDVRNYFKRQGTIAPERTDEEIDAELALAPPTDLIGKDKADHSAKLAADAAAANPMNGAADGKPGAPASGGSSQASAPDFGPLAAAIQALAEKPAAEVPPIDWAPLIDALKNQPAPVFDADMTPIADAIREMKDMPPPAMPEHVFNIDARTTVGIPEQPAPIVNVAQPDITVNSPDVNVAAPTVNVAAPDVSVTVEKSGNRTGTMTKQPDGSFAMTVKENP